ncbi:carbon-nitrogen hydrolase family protein [Halobaculum sp. MBLA0147]|uniref:carbon-nitrogen hydrolase family protein n=1 Tax=Halobaculum sp. MBLA0147 TaxID=3079934 RepID=UPI003523B873
MPTVAACQIEVADLDVETNRETITERLVGLPESVDVAVFPEYALTGFVADERVAAGAVARDGPALDAIHEAAADADVAVTVGFVEAAPDEEELYNATAYLDPGGPDDRTVYRKRHLWGGEDRVLTPGSERVTVRTPVGRAGIVTCYDLNFVDESAALAEPDVAALLVGGAWPAAYTENWRLLLRARALDGVRWVVGAGRTGTKRVADADPTTYGGRSLVARPDGGVHRELDRQPRDLVTEVDEAVLRDQREVVGVFGDEGPTALDDATE